MSLAEPRPGSATVPGWLTKEALLRLVAENAPVFYLYPTDRFMPTPVDWFIARSELWLHAQVCLKPLCRDRCLATEALETVTDFIN